MNVTFMYNWIGMNFFWASNPSLSLLDPHVLEKCIWLKSWKIGQKLLCFAKILQRVVSCKNRKLKGDERQGEEASNTAATGDGKLSNSINRISHLSSGVRSNGLDINKFHFWKMYLPCDLKNVDLWGFQTFLTLRHNLFWKKLKAMINVGVFKKKDG